MPWEYILTGDAYLSGDGGPIPRLGEPQVPFIDWYQALNHYGARGWEVVSWKRLPEKGVEVLLKRELPGGDGVVLRTESYREREDALRERENLHSSLARRPPPYKR
jgi:hypothetical protein